VLSIVTIEQAYQTASPVEAFGESATRQFLADKRIVAHSITDSSRATLDSAFDMINDTLNNWTRGQIYLALNDFSILRVTSMSPSEKRLLETHYLAPEVLGFVAIIIPKGVVGQLLRMYFNTRGSMARQVHAFFTTEEALRFLLDKLNNQPDAAPPSTS
jgi:hypothetical protein